MKQLKTVITQTILKLAATISFIHCWKSHLKTFRERRMSIKQTEQLRVKLENSLGEIVGSLGAIQIGNKEQFPYGWRKAAKGRTVWRILEEAITQNLEKDYTKHGFSDISAAESEVGVFDFSGVLKDESDEFYVNIKSAVVGGRTNKDDISKAERLKGFFDENIERKLFVATFFIEFHSDMSVTITNVKVMPVMWLPDIYVNPSNNGNLQSSKYKDISLAVKRTNQEFYDALIEEMAVAREKKAAKARNN